MKVIYSVYQIKIKKQLRDGRKNTIFVKKLIVYNFVIDYMECDSYWNNKNSRFVIGEIRGNNN